MSKYTTEVRYICETEAGFDHSVGYEDVDKVIALAIPKIFSFDFPLYDSSYRNVLCTKILRHFYTREIGAETYGLWKLRLESKLNEIMPYYNKLYESGLKDFNPLWDTQMETSYQGNKAGESSETGSSKEAEKGSDDTARSLGDVLKSKAKTVEDVSGNNTSTEVEGYTDTQKGDKTDKYSDTPQGGLAGVEEGVYLTNARIVGEDITKTRKAETTLNGQKGSHGTVDYENEDKRDVVEGIRTDKNYSKDIDTSKQEAAKSTEDYVLKVSGRNGGDVGKALEALKNELLNIDMMIIHDLEPLFMLIW